jgi:hypothetical protein
MSLNVGIKIDIAKLKQSLSQAQAAFKQFLGQVKPIQAGIGRLTPTPQMAANMGRIPGFNPQTIMQNLNPAQLQKYSDSMMDLNDQYRNMRNMMQQAIPAGADQKVMMNSLQNIFNKTAETIAGRVSPEFKMFSQAVRDAGYKGQIFGKNFAQIANTVRRSQIAGALGGTMKSFGKMFTDVGKRLSWFGFRLTMMGRMITRELAKPLKKSLQNFKNWDKSIQSVATSMGMLSAFGLMNADRFDMMNKAMNSLPKTGMMVQGAIGALQALMINIGADIIPIIIPAILDLVDAFSRLWEENKGQLIPVIENLVNNVFPALIDIIDEVGGEFMTSFVEGLSGSIGWMGDFLAAIEPILPALGEWLGKIVGIAPLMSILGTVLFSTSVPLQLLGYLFGGLGGTIARVAMTALRFGVPFSTLGIVFAGIGIIIATVILHFKQIKEAIQTTLMPAITRLKDAWSKLTGGMFENASAMDILKAATFPFSLAIRGIIWVVSAAIEVLAFLMDMASTVGTVLFNLGYRLAELFTSIPDMISGAIDGIKDFVDELDILGRISDALFGNSIGEDIQDQMGIANTAFQGLRSQTRLATAELKALPSAVEVGDMTGFTNTPTSGGGTKEVYITLELNIENVSSDVDVDELADRVSRAIADRVR